MNDVRVRWAKASDLTALVKFFTHVYKRTHITTQKKHLAWNFGSPLLKILQSKLTAVVAEERKFGLVAFLGAYPADFSVKGKRFKAAWLANWITREEFRGQGIGSTLLKKMSVRFELALAASFSSLAWPLYLKHGWRKLGMYRRVVFVLNPSRAYAFLKTLHAPAALKGTSTTSFKTSLPRGLETELDIHWDGPLDFKAWERSWPLMRERYGGTVERSAAYLRWRFFEHPFIRYHIGVLYLPDKTIGGLVVLRREATRGFVIGRIVDIVSLPEADQVLIRAAVNFARKKSYAALDGYFTFAPYLAGFGRAGFRSGDRRPFLLLPEFFNPVALRPRDRRKQTILMGISARGLKTLPETGQWHIVKADGDRDRAY